MPITVAILLAIYLCVGVIIYGVGEILRDGIPGYNTKEAVAIAVLWPMLIVLAAFEKLFRLNRPKR